MMVVHCDHLDREVMIWANGIIGLDNTDHGVVVTYKCACGEIGQVLTGSRARHEVSAHVAA